MQRIRTKNPSHNQFLLKLKLPNREENRPLTEPALVAPVPEVIEGDVVGDIPPTFTIDVVGDPSPPTSRPVSGRDDTPLNPWRTRWAKCRWSGVCAGDTGDIIVTGEEVSSWGDVGGGDIVGCDNCKG